MSRDILTPEAQSDPHHWAATFGGHAWIALGPWGVIAMTLDMWTAAWLTPLLYLFIWEGIQLSLAKKVTPELIWDSVLDTVGVAFGCYAAALLGNDYQFAAVVCWGASVGVIVSGWRVRE